MDTFSNQVPRCSNDVVVTVIACVASATQFVISAMALRQLSQATEGLDHHCSDRLSKQVENWQSHQGVTLGSALAVVPPATFMVMGSCLLRGMRDRGDRENDRGRYLYAFSMARLLTVLLAAPLFFTSVVNSWVASSMTSNMSDFSEEWGATFGDRSAAYMSVIEWDFRSAAFGFFMGLSIIAWGLVTTVVECLRVTHRAPSKCDEV